MSGGTLEESFGFDPAAVSTASVKPSLSSSVSVLSPIPSPSVSSCSEGSNGNASDVSGVPSLSSSVSIASGIPSLSVSTGVLAGFNGSKPNCVSYVSEIPSLSSSGSNISIVPSPSVSVSYTHLKLQKKMIV